MRFNVSAIAAIRTFFTILVIITLFSLAALYNGMNADKWYTYRDQESMVGVITELDREPSYRSGQQFERGPDTWTITLNVENGGTFIWAHPDYWMYVEQVQVGQKVRIDYGTRYEWMKGPLWDTEPECKGTRIMKVERVLTPEAE